MELREYDIRSMLKKNLHEQHEQDPSVRILDEMGICQGKSRIDIAVINSKLCGYEIKSERDTLHRLPRQIDFYGRVFDQVYLVTSGEHIENANELIPDWWGVIQAEEVGGEMQLTTTRPATPNTGQEPLAVAQLLWKWEVLTELEERGIDWGVRSKTRKAMWERLCEHVGLEEVCAIARRRLKDRENWRSD